MSHLALYRKYRPQDFAAVAGQTHIVRILRNSVASGKVAHAYLFSGPRGTGKTSTARILAKALNCERQESEPCNACDSCEHVTQGRSLDVVEIDAASHGSVDDARDLREKVAYAPVAGRWRLYIIDECHMLSNAANNALLKVLEEPPSHVVFVFATTEPNKVLQTLRDRCQRFEFRPVSSEEIAAHLQKVAASEGMPLVPGGSAVIAQKAAGSMRDALGLLEQVAVFGDGELDAARVDSILGTDLSEAAIEATDIVARNDVAECFAFVERVVSRGQDLKEFINIFGEHLRSLFLVSHASGSQGSPGGAPGRQELIAQAGGFESQEMLRLMTLCAQIQSELRASPNSRLTVEIGMVRMARLELDTTPQALLARMHEVEQLVRTHISGLQAGVSTPSRTVPEAASPVLEVVEPAAEEQTGEPADAVGVSQAASGDTASIDDVLKAWPAILEKIKRRKISIHALLIPALPVAFDGSLLSLSFPRKAKFHKETFSDPAYHPVFTEAFRECTGVVPGQIVCEMAGEEEEPESGGRSGNLPSTSESNTGEPIGATMSGPDEKAEQKSHGQEMVDDPVAFLRQGFGAAVIEEFRKQ